MPLRAWYPVEVFEFRSGGERGVDEEEARGIAEETLACDDALRDALRGLRDGQELFALPIDGRERAHFRSPDVVDDAAYAVECAAVGEVDLPRLEAYSPSWSAGRVAGSSGSGRALLRSVSRRVRAAGAR